jgi:hypothetical protein
MDWDKEARIRERAYEIWVREGRPHGRDAEHWQKAEAEITAETGAVADRAAAGSKPQSEAPGAAPVAPGPGAGTAPPLRSRRAAPKPARSDAPGTSESSGAGRRGKKS